MDTKLTITVSHLNFLDGFWRMIMGIPILTILTAILFTDVAIAANKYFSAAKREMFRWFSVLPMVLVLVRTLYEWFPSCGV